MDKIALALKIKEIAQSYHDREVGSSLCMPNQLCQCCNNPTISTFGIEHDSGDITKDIALCIDCYTKVVIYWEKHSPNKVAPI